MRAREVDRIRRGLTCATAFLKRCAHGRGVQGRCPSWRAGAPIHPGVFDDVEKIRREVWGPPVGVIFSRPSWVGKVARLTGLEPATPGVTGRYSNQLSYNRSLPSEECLPERGGPSRRRSGCRQAVSGAEMCIFSEKSRGPLSWPCANPGDRQLLLGFQAVAALIPTRGRRLRRGKGSADCPAFDRRGGVSASQSRCFGESWAPSCSERSPRCGQKAPCAASVTLGRQANALILLTIPCIRERRLLCRIVSFA